MGTVRFATVGTSVITTCFLNALARVDGAEFVGAYSRHLEKAREFAQGVRPDATAWDSLDELAGAPDVDAVYLASPNALHPEQALRFIEAGKHVFVEKPFAPNAREAAEVFDAAREHGVVAMEAMRLAHDPAYRALAEAIRRIAPVRLSRLSFCTQSSRYDLVREGKPSNIFDPEFAGGALMDLGVYVVNVALALFGEPRGLSAQAVLREVPCASGARRPIDIAGIAVLHYDGHECTLEYSKSSVNRLGCQVQGEAGTLLFDSLSFPRDARIVWPDGREEALAPRSEEDARAFEQLGDLANMVFETRDFVAAVRGERSVEADAARTIAALSVMDEVRRQTGLEFPHH